MCLVRQFDDERTVHRFKLSSKFNFLKDSLLFNFLENFPKLQDNELMDKEFPDDLWAYASFFVVSEKNKQDKALKKLLTGKTLVTSFYV